MGKYGKPLGIYGNKTGKSPGIWEWENIPYSNNHGLTWITTLLYDKMGNGTWIKNHGLVSKLISSPVVAKDPIGI